MSRVTTKDVIAAVCHYYRLRPEELLRQNHHYDLSHPRQVGFLLCREFTPCSLTYIAQQFGRQDHTTVRKGIENLRRRMGKPESVDMKAVRILRYRLNELAVETYPQAHVRVWSQWTARCAGA